MPRNPFWTSGQAERLAASAQWQAPAGMLALTYSNGLGNADSAGSLTGTLTAGEFRDFIRVSLTAGASYRFDGSGAGPVDLAVFDNQGFMMSFAGPSGSANPPVSSIANFVADYTGTFVIGLTFYMQGNPTGPWTVSATEDLFADGKNNGPNALPPLLLSVVRGGSTTTEAATTYSGPVIYIQYQYLGSASGEAVAGTAANEFMNLLGGDDAADGGAGDDVLDGGTGSNFLTGGAGKDVFFLDGRGGTVTWGTITDWQAGEQLSVWGWKPGVSKMQWVALDGTAGWEGVTLHMDLDGNGQIDTSVTWTGKAQSDLPKPLEFDGLLWFT